MSALNLLPCMEDRDFPGVELGDMSRFILKHSLLEYWEVTENPKSGQKLGYSLTIRSTLPLLVEEPAGDIERSYSTSATRNQAIDELVKGRGHAQADWKGEILVVKRAYTSNLDDDDQEHRTEDEASHEDFRPSDIKAIVDFLTEYGYEDLDRRFETSRRTVQGLKMTCPGDQTTFGHEPYELTDVPLNFPIFSQSPTQMSQRIEFPIIVRRYTTDQLWLTDEEQLQSKGSKNQAATFLNLDLREDEEGLKLGFGRLGYGWAPPEWQGFVGTIVAVRQDGMSLDPNHLEVLCDFCQYHMGPHIFQDYLVDNGRKAAIDRALTRNAFEEYFQAYETRKIGDDASWEVVLSPYYDVPPKAPSRTEADA